MHFVRLSSHQTSTTYVLFHRMWSCCQLHVLDKPNFPLLTLYVYLNSRSTISFVNHTTFNSSSPPFKITALDITLFVGSEPLLANIRCPYHFFRSIITLTSFYLIKVLRCESQNRHAHVLLTNVTCMLLSSIQSYVFCVWPFNIKLPLSLLHKPLGPKSL